jgi:hypothetical protein
LLPLIFNNWTRAINREFINYIHLSQLAHVLNDNKSRLQQDTNLHIITLFHTLASIMWMLVSVQTSFLHPWGHQRTKKLVLERPWVSDGNALTLWSEGKWIMMHLFNYWIFLWYHNVLSFSLLLCKDKIDKISYH